MVLLDVEKAFDTVWHKGLVYKLISYGIPLYLVKIVQSFLTNRSYNVFINSSYSEKYNIDAGVPQGSVLGLCCTFYIVQTFLKVMYVTMLFMLTILQFTGQI